MAKYLLVSLVLISLALISIPVFAGDGGASTRCSNPVREIIDETASIKEMQSQPARAISYVYDVLGNKIPTQTEKAGKL